MLRICYYVVEINLLTYLLDGGSGSLRLSRESPWEIATLTGGVLLWFLKKKMDIFKVMR